MDMPRSANFASGSDFLNALSIWESGVNEKALGLAKLYANTPAFEGPLKWCGSEKLKCIRLSVDGVPDYDRYILPALSSLATSLQNDGLDAERLYHGIEAVRGESNYVIYAQVA